MHFVPRLFSLSHPKMVASKLSVLKLAKIWLSFDVFMDNCRPKF